MAEENINTLAEKYQELRNIPGAVGGGEYDERVDSSEGEKYTVLKVSLKKEGDRTWLLKYIVGVRWSTWFTWYSCCRYFIKTW